MAEYPAMPLWTDSYLGDTVHLTTIEHGCYLMLLMTMWRAGGKLPNDDKLLARYARLGPQQWKRIKPIVFPFFQVVGGSIIQPRLNDELIAVKQRSKRQANNARAKYRKSLEPCAAMAEPNTPFGSPSISIPIKEKGIDKSIPKKRTPKKEISPRQELEKILSPQAAKNVIEWRQKLKKPLSHRGAELMAGEFAKINHPDAGADMMIEKGWQGFKADWYHNAKSQEQENGTDTRKTEAELIAIMRA